MEKLSYHYLQQENEKLRKELKETQELWQMAIESSKLGVWDWDMSTNEVFFSDI